MVARVAHNLAEAEVGLVRLLLREGEGGQEDGDVDDDKADGHPREPRDPLILVPDGNQHFGTPGLELAPSSPRR